MKAISFDFTSLRVAYLEGITPEQIVEQAFARIAAVNDPGIFLHLRDKAEVLAEAKALGAYDPSRPLWGIPFAIKDNIDLGGAPTTAACPAFTYAAERDAHVVGQLRAAGALLIGKTNLDQFATGLVGVRSPYPIPKNAVDPAIVPGGSSSGSAVAVAHGIVSFSLGTDTAGSGRVPAALNNIVGLKPTLGALSNTGVVPACRTLDTISIFALTVPDAYAAFRVAAHYDPADAFARPIAAQHLSAPPQGLTIGVPDAKTIEFFGDAIQQASFADALSRLRGLGFILREIDFTPFYEVAKMLYEGAWVAERMTVIEDMMRSDPEAIHPVTRQIVGAADRLSAADAFRGIYRLADLKRAAEPALAGVDLLCVPTIPTFYSVADLEADPVTPNSNFGTYTNFVNLMDMCGIAVPTAPRGDGRPGSVTFLARAGQDALTAALAQILHRDCAPTLGATGTALPDAPLPAPGPMAGEAVIAVVGAHMSGLPLNGQLTSRGARFLEETSTAPTYRFHALAGGPPARPGLIRAPQGGSSIALELWAMPQAQVGSFLAEIPAPLGIGTIALADGRSVQGFLVEHAGLEGATEITDLGGWRAYLASLPT
jgi:allophanate hydrolase